MEEYEVDLREYIKVIVEKKWFILGIMLLCIVVAGAYVKTQPLRYETKATIMIASMPSAPELNGDGASSSLRLTPRVYEKLFITNDVIERIIQALDLNIAVEDLRGALSANVELAKSGKDLSDLPFITLEVQGANPERIKEMADIWVEIAVNKSAELISSHTAESYDYLLEMYEEVDSDLKAKQQEKLDYMETHPLATAQTELDVLKGIYNKELNELYNNKDSLETSKSRLSSINRLVGSSTTSIDKSLQLQLAVEKGVYVSLSDYKSAQQVDVDTLQDSIDFLEKDTEELSGQINTKEQEVTEFRTYYEQVDYEITSLRSRRDVLFAKLQEAKIAKGVEATSIRVIEQPVLPKRPADPKLQFKLMIAAVAGLFIGVFLAFFRHYMEEEPSHPRRSK